MPGPTAASAAVPTPCGGPCGRAFPGGRRCLGPVARWRRRSGGRGRRGGRLPGHAPGPGRRRGERCGRSGHHHRVDLAAAENPEDVATDTADPPGRPPDHLRGPRRRRGRDRRGRLRLRADRGGRDLRPHPVEGRAVTGAESDASDASTTSCGRIGSCPSPSSSRAPGPPQVTYYLAAGPGRGRRSDRRRGRPIDRRHPPAPAKRPHAPESWWPGRCRCAPIVLRSTLAPGACPGAADLREFDPGNIISDAVFFDGRRWTPGADPGLPRRQGPGLRRAARTAPRA